MLRAVTLCGRITSIQLNGRSWLSAWYGVEPVAGALNVKLSSVNIGCKPRLFAWCPPPMVRGSTTRETNAVCISRRNAMSISKKLRFEVFKRDKFTCQYCGRSAPDVILHVDHIHPRSKKGKDNILNLVTSCLDCNQGKGDRTLDDNAIIKRQHEQLKLIQERREQLEMLMQWQQALLEDEDTTAVELSKIWQLVCAQYSVTQHGMNDIRKWCKRYSVVEIADAMKISCEQYLRYDDEDPSKPTAESAAKAWEYIPRIIVGQKRLNAKPYLRDLYYIRGILRNRLSYFKDHEGLRLLEQAYEKGASIEDLKAFSLVVRNWTTFKHELEAIINYTDGDQ